MFECVCEFILLDEMWVFGHMVLCFCQCRFTESNDMKCGKPVFYAASKMKCV